MASVVDLRQLACSWMPCSKVCVSSQIVEPWPSVREVFDSASMRSTAHSPAEQILCYACSAARTVCGSLGADRMYAEMLDGVREVRLVLSEMQTQKLPPIHGRSEEHIFAQLYIAGWHGMLLVLVMICV